MPGPLSGTSRRLAPEAPDEGMTLVELVVTVAILGIIVTALTGVVINYLRTSVETQGRLTESRDVQLASAYFQRDVASIGVRADAFDDATQTFPLLQSVNVTPCATIAGDTQVVTLAWSEYTNTGTEATPAPAQKTVKITYVTRVSGATLDMIRIRCDSTAVTTVRNQVADNLSAAAPPVLTCQNSAGASIACTGAGASVPAVITLQLTSRDPDGRVGSTYTATLTGERRQT